MRAAGVTVFWDEYIGVQAYWCQGVGSTAGQLYDEKQLGQRRHFQACVTVRGRGSQRTPGSAQEPVTKPSWGSQGSPIQMLSPNHPPSPGVVPRLGGSRSFALSSNPPLPSPPRAGRCCHRPRQPGPGALSPLPPKRGALYRRSPAPSTPLRSPERSPQPGGSQSPPAGPHLPAARSLPSSRSPARPALTSHLRAGRSRRRPSLSRARRPALSFAGQ